MPCSNFNGMAVLEMTKRVLLGQMVSFLNSVTGVSTTKLVDADASYAMLQSLTAYVFILAVYGPLFLFVYFKYRSRRYADFKFLQRWWKYVILAVVDLEANFCVVYAYQYTNMMSIQLLGCFTVPCVLVLSFVLLRSRFALTHVAGGIIALGGLAMLIALDADGLSRSGTGPNPVLGDILALISSMLYATSNVLTEWFVKPSKGALQFPCCPRLTGGKKARAKEGQQQQQQEGEEAAAAEGREREEERGPDAVTATGREHAAEVSERRSRAREGGDSNSGDNSRAAAGAEECNEPADAAVTALAENDLSAAEAVAEEAEELPKVHFFIPVIENLAVMSFFAAVLSLVQFFAVDWKTFAPKRSEWTAEDWLFQMVFGLTMLCIYTALPLLFILTSAAFANISLLTNNIYSIIWNVAVFHIYPTKLFIVAYIIIVVGILLYNLTDVIRIPCCARWNYPCGEVVELSEEEEDEDDDGDDVMAGGTAQQQQQQQQQQHGRGAGVLANGEGEEELQDIASCKSKGGKAGAAPARASVEMDRDGEDNQSDERAAQRTVF